MQKCCSTQNPLIAQSAALSRLEDRWMDGWVEKSETGRRAMLMRANTHRCLGSWRKARLHAPRTSLFAREVLQSQACCGKAWGACLCERVSRRMLSLNLVEMTSAGKLRRRPRGKHASSALIPLLTIPLVDHVTNNNDSDDRIATLQSSTVDSPQNVGTNSFAGRCNN